jgi:hypothetical protein
MAERSRTWTLRGAAGLTALLSTTGCRTYDPARDPYVPSAPVIVYVERGETSAPPEAVWETLTRFSAYEAWNPWIVEAQGEARVGAEVVVKAMLGKPRPSRFRHRVTEVVVGERLCWRDAGAAHDSPSS